MEETYKVPLRLKDIATIPIKSEKYNHMVRLGTNSEIYAWGHDSSNSTSTQPISAIPDIVDAPECPCGKKLDKYDVFLQKKHCFGRCSAKPKCTKCNKHLDYLDNSWGRTTCYGCNQ